MTIIALILAYTLVYGITKNIILPQLSYFDGGHMKDESILASIFWPVTFMMLLITIPFLLIDKIFDRIM